VFPLLSNWIVALRQYNMRGSGDCFIHIYLSGECDGEAFCSVAVPIPVVGPVKFSSEYLKSNIKAADRLFEFGILYRIDRKTRRRTALGVIDEVLDLENFDYIYELGPSASYPLFAQRLRHRRLLEQSSLVDKANKLLHNEQNNDFERKQEQYSRSVHIRFPPDLKHSWADDLHLGEGSGHDVSVKDDIADNKVMLSDAPC